MSTVQYCHCRHSLPLTSFPRKGAIWGYEIVCHQNQQKDFHPTAAIGDTFMPCSLLACSTCPCSFPCRTSPRQQLGTVLAYRVRTCPPYMSHQYCTSCRMNRSCFCRYRSLGRRRRTCPYHRGTLLVYRVRTCHPYSFRHPCTSCRMYRSCSCRCGSLGRRRCTCPYHQGTLLAYRVRTCHPYSFRHSCTV